MDSPILCEVLRNLKSEENNSESVGNVMLYGHILTCLCKIQVFRLTSSPDDKGQSADALYVTSRFYYETHTIYTTTFDGKFVWHFI